MKKIEIYEPFFFLFFGAFHLHRIWGLVDRQSYAEFWMELMRDKGALYYLLFDLFAIAAGLEFWERLLLKMFDVSAWYWNLLGGCFILLGGFAFGLGI